MSTSKLPERASLDYLKKLAKDRLRELRASEPLAKLSAAQLAVAQEHGFSSWRALKAEIDAARAPTLSAFFLACRNGDVAALAALLEREPSLVRARNAEGRMGLHLAVAHVGAVQALLAAGADPDARDVGDNAYPLHYAAQGAHLASVRALLDAGGDVHGFGDVHRSEVIGWATDRYTVPRDIVELLLERGAEHHIFSAIAMADLALVQALYERDPDLLMRRRSRFEQGQTALHYAVVALDGLSARAIVPQYDMLELLIELGADLEAVDDKGRTALAAAMSRGDREAMRRLHAAGAKVPAPGVSEDFTAGIGNLADSVQEQATPMLQVADMNRALAWYAALGFEVTAKNEQNGAIDWASLTFGKGSLMLALGRQPGVSGVSLWFGTTEIDELFRLLKARQLTAARAALAGEPGAAPEIHFVEELYTAHFGGKQFSVRDPDGTVLYFRERAQRASARLQQM